MALLLDDSRRRNHGPFQAFQRAETFNDPVDDWCRECQQLDNRRFSAMVALFPAAFASAARSKR